MAKLESNTVINRPVEEVFALLSNTENDPQWAASSIEVKKSSEGPIGLGTTWRAVRKTLGRRIESEAQVTEYEPNRKYALKSKSGPFSYEVRMHFERGDGGTRVNFLVEVEPGGFFKLAEPLVMSIARRQFETDLAHLKDLMEAHAL